MTVCVCVCVFIEAEVYTQGREGPVDASPSVSWGPGREGQESLILKQTLG